MKHCSAVRATTSTIVAVVARSRDVEENQLIRSLCIVGFRAFHGIARVAKIEKFRAFDHTASGDVETGNNALR
jgi:hypothetical protein